ncbi:MAG TPA: hypothetical protein ENF75_05710 [Acidilobales archaeon]|nr:hypothetical protein [Acidilobales archaeon]
MSMSRKFKEHRKVLNELGVKILDVYRFKDKEAIRGLYKGKVVMIELPRHREFISPDEFKEIVMESLKSKGRK